ncbi:hypothetical protein GmRootA79_31580 [Acidovorax sp. A79]
MGELVHLAQVLALVEHGAPGADLLGPLGAVALEGEGLNPVQVRGAEYGPQQGCNGQCQHHPEVRGGPGRVLEKWLQEMHGTRETRLPCAEVTGFNQWLQSCKKKLCEFQSKCYVSILHHK